jgi:hypothetical protein
MPKKVAKINIESVVMGSLKGNFIWASQNHPQKKLKKIKIEKQT